MSQAKDLENFTFELAKAENLSACRAQAYAVELCDCLEWDQDFADNFTNSVYDRVDRWRSWCEREDLGPSNYIEQ